MARTLIPGESSVTDAASGCVGERLPYGEESLRHESGLMR